MTPAESTRRCACDTFEKALQEGNGYGGPFIQWVNDRELIFTTDTMLPPFNFCPWCGGKVGT